MEIGKRNRKRIESARNRAEHINWSLNYILTSDTDEANGMAHLESCLYHAECLHDEIEEAIAATRKREGIKR